MIFGKIRRFFRKLKKTGKWLKSKVKGIRQFFQHIWVAVVYSFIRRPYAKTLIAIAIIAGVILAFEIYAYIQELKELKEMGQNP